jgi:transcriptional regulator with XRE-family HTH domain
MFEIGEQLRQARTRQGLELSDVEAATRIGSRYLAALEQERFERLPALAYARVFLRSYADFLDLDSTLFLEEFDARLADPEPPPPPPRKLPPGPPGRTTLVIAGAGVAVLASVLAFAFSGGTQHHLTPPPSPPKQQASTGQVVPLRPTHSHHSPAARLPVSHLVLAASRGDCWLSVHAGSAAGPLLYQGILAQGHSLQFFRRWLWIRMGAPSALTVTLNGSPVTTLPTQTGNVLVTPGGVRPY